MRHRVRDTTWQQKLKHLMYLIRISQSGDEIVVRSEAMRDQGELFRQLHCPDKEIIWVVEPLRGE